MRVPTFAVIRRAYRPRPRQTPAPVHSLPEASNASQEPARPGWGRHLHGEVLGEFSRFGEVDNGDPLLSARGQRRVG